MDTYQIPSEIPPVEAPKQFARPEFPFLIEVDDFLWVSRARQAFRVTGEGLAVAVLDTGINAQHVDFEGRIPIQRNFTPDNNGNPDDATDGNGHGTNVAGIIAANADHIGIAPGANIIPLKVLANNGSGNFGWIDQALGWVIENRALYNITAVSVSIGDGGNYTHDNFGQNAIQDKIRTLRQENVPVMIAAGNDYFSHQSQQGMSFPAIIRECVSVGAVYDADEGAFSYGSGAKAFSSGPGQITPFSQRLHPSKNKDTYTDVFAPGAPVTSSGIMGDHGESTQHGTSQATPVVTGLVLLLQDFYCKVTNQMPTVGQLVRWLRRGGVTIHDGDDENDNVAHTNLDYVRVDALSALDAVRRALNKQRLGND